MDKKSLTHLKRAPLDLSERAMDMENVQRMWLQGHKTERDYTQISKELNLSRAYVKELVTEFKEIYSSDRYLRERTKEIVGEFDQTYDNLKAELYRAANDAENESDTKTRVTALKSIGDLEAKRVDTLQKSGLLANMDMAEQIAENEAKQAALIQIIKDVTAKYPELKSEIARRISQLNNQVEVVEVVPE
jgi:hypothetical protein